MLRSTLSFLVTITLVALTSLSCGSGKNQKLTFAVGGAPAELDVWAELLRDFTQKSGIAVDMIRQPTDTDQRRQSMVTALKSRERDPDLFLMDVAWVGQFAASDWLEPLDQSMRQDSLDRQVFFARVLNQADMYDSQLVALPVYVDGGLLYYRTDLLQKYGFDGPPQTWLDLVNYSQKVMAGERKDNQRFTGFVWQGAQYEGLMCTFLEFAASTPDGGITLDQGQVRVNTPANVKAATFMRDLIHKYKVSPPSTYTEMKEEEVRQYFQKGNALFERNWPYAWSLHQAEGSPVRGKVGIAPLPHFDAGHSASTLGGWHVGISRFSDQKEQAWQLVHYITSRQVQKELALRLGWNPGRRDIYNDPEVLEKMPHLAQLKAVFENAVARLQVPYYSQLSQVFQRHLNAVLADRAQPEEALQKAQTEMQAVVERYSE